MSRENVLAAADRIARAAKEQPDLFKTKKRAMGMRDRVACWLAGALVATIADKLITGTANYPTTFMAGMIFAAVLIYFDPPAIQTTHTLRDSDRHREADETAKTGSVGEADRARAEGIAPPNSLKSEDQ